MDNIKNIFAPILVVEDNSDHALIIINSLKENRNFMNEIIHMKNGRDATQFLKKEGKYKDDITQKPMLILLDVKLPLKNGFQVLEEIKFDEKLREIPVVMFTTTSNTEDISKAMRMGANDYIIKPLKFADFTEKVSKLAFYWSVISDVNKIFS
ncbi:MAG: response regulator [Leptospiraceae bacterium]|nr:response regulator [Leptospiraceae bacterium]